MSKAIPAVQKDMTPCPHSLGSKQTRSCSRVFWAVLFGVGGCAHSQLTADEHRLQASREETAAAHDQARFDASRTMLIPATGIGAQGLERYNPTAGFLGAADVHLREAHQHLVAAESMERFEDQRCVGLSPAERSACPLFTRLVDRVEENPEGVKLHFREGAPIAKALAQMQCHLAYAQVHGFQQSLCPLYVRGLTIDARPGDLIELHADEPEAAARLRREARTLFGAP